MKTRTLTLAGIAVAVLFAVFVAIGVRPTHQVSATGAEQIAAGSLHTCAIVEGDRLTCWGRNGSGQLGDGTMIDRSTPVYVLAEPGGDPLSGVAAISADSRNTCALMTGSGGVKCWGDNQFGQLGDTTKDDSSTPVSITGFAGSVASISVGDGHVCAVLVDERAQCWGENDNAALGDGTAMNRIAPTLVCETGESNPCSAFLATASAVGTGGAHSCAITDTDRLRCWGRTSGGQIGNGPNTGDIFTPVYVCPVGTPPPPACEGGNVVTGIQDVDLGAQTSCALSSTQGVLCWGHNNFGQVGDGNTGSDPETPIQVIGLSGGATDQSTGSTHSCAVTPSGGVRCWGNNQFGALGNGSETNSSTPVDVCALGATSCGSMMTDAAAIVTGSEHTCALTEKAKIRCWGSNQFGQLGGVALDTCSMIPCSLTPTRVGKSVGGIAELPDADGPPLEARGSSGRSPVALAWILAVAAAVITLATGAWVVRRR